VGANENPTRDEIQDLRDLSDMLQEQSLTTELGFQSSLQSAFKSSRNSFPDAPAFTSILGEEL
jgi:hypothetical protein